MIEGMKLGTTIISKEQPQSWTTHDDVIKWKHPPRHRPLVRGAHFGKILTHWGRETHICVSKLTIIGSDNGLSPDRRQAIIWTNAGILLIVPLGTNFSEILIEILTFSFTKMHLKMSSAKWRLFGLGLNELTTTQLQDTRHHCYLSDVQANAVTRWRY